MLTAAPMRPLPLLIVLAVPLAAAGCADTHGLDVDSGPAGDAGCGGGSPLICVSSCGGDAGLSPICTATGWACPPGTRDLSTCPPTCHGPPPSSACVCRGTSWSCPSAACPTDFNPWDPTDPRSACSPEGSTCSSGGTDPCSSAMSCTCTSGHWNCAIAEADPVCWCGRQPSEGDRCVEEGASCGECCPTPGGTGWPAMQCAGGHWTAAACPPVVCPPLPAPECPAQALTLLGLACSVEGAQCGDPCCSDSTSCHGGVWIRGPEADCALCSEYACGPGLGRADQTCTSRCGPADGIEFVCAPRDPGCSDCSCVPVGPSQRCEMIDGHPNVVDVGFCAL